MKVLKVWLLAILIRPMQGQYSCSKVFLTNVCCDNMHNCRSCTDGTTSSNCDGLTGSQSLSCGYTTDTCSAAVDCSSFTAKTLTGGIAALSYTQNTGT